MPALPFLALALLAQTADNGKLVTDVAGFPTQVPPYEAFVARRQALLKAEAELAAVEKKTFVAPEIAQIVPSREAYAEIAKDLAKIECRRLTYLSDGLKVTAYLWKPPIAAGSKLPLIIYNRGGNQESGKITGGYTFMLHPYLRAGYAVLASQYRGNDGGEGKEEFGGADVHDVMNLLPLATNLGSFDMKNVFMLGDSRGGMMTLLALKHGATVNAAAVRAAPTDFSAGLKRRPEGEQLFATLIPGYSDHKAASQEERSAVNWPEKINAPLFIAQGTADWRVDPTDALRLAQGLQANGKRYSLAMYEGDNHSLMLNFDDVNERVLAWFARFSTSVK